MSAPATPEPIFLQNPTRDQLLEAVAWNHRELFVLQALAAGGEAHQAEGVTWTYAGPKGESMILFPRLAEANAGQQLDAIVGYYRERQPEKLVGCWSLDPPQPPDLEVPLLARGFQLGWRPCWMWLDLEQMQAVHPWPEGLKVEVLDAADLPDADNLPSYDADMAAVQHAITGLQPRRMWRFAAFLDGRTVGQSTLFLTTGPLGVAGIYNVGVVPEARNQGIGKAVTIAACQQALALGCRHALLNATGERMYRQIGFDRIGYGWTWWLNVPRLEAHPPTPEQVTLAEAVGRGDQEALAALGKQTTARTLDMPLPNGMTLLQLAVHAEQRAAAEWLIAHGAILDVVSAWDLGWRERVPQLLAARPELANQRLGEMQTTPLHVAVERNDIELARLVLAANPDLAIEDAVFHATPLGWARHFQRAEILQLLESSQAPSSG